MSTHVVTMGEDIQFAPDSTVNEILQNIRTILNTRVGTVPLDRDFGISWDAVDEPIPIAQARLRMAVIQAINRYEPRAKVESVQLRESMEDTMDGSPVTAVTISIEDENE